MDGRIQWRKRTNEYYLCYSYELEPRDECLTEEEVLTKGRLMAIDSGNRTLASYYLPSGEHGKLVDGDFGSRIEHVLKWTDEMQSLATKETRNRWRRERLWRGHHRRLDRAKIIRTTAHDVAI